LGSILERVGRDSLFRSVAVDARQSRVHFAASACAVAAGLFIVMRTWVAGVFHGQNPFPVLEAVLTWLPMLYAITYALRESKRENAV
jgi:hypothetical protein